MSWIVVDVEADGPSPGRYSMVSFGAIVVEPSLSRTFYGEVRPISDEYIPEALAVSNITREQHQNYGEPAVVMTKFAEWIRQNSNGRAVFVSDNVAFDWQWINYYFCTYTDLGSRSATRAGASATCIAAW
jgi:DNA polymerase III epsilon subunit-like protein